MGLYLAIRAILNSPDFLLLIVVAIAAAFAAWIFVPKQRQRALFERVDAITDGHMDELTRQQTILVRTDPYGKPLLDKWHAEIIRFITHHVRPELKPAQVPVLEKQRNVVLGRIAQRVAASAQQRPSPPAIPANMSGAEFESFCASQLRTRGWDVQVTPLCRDQGVDIIAEKNSVRVALQCKLYSNPVGNKAVQEIAAGRVHQQAQYGAVVTNGTFTASAKQLAATNSILLLHYTDLPQLEMIVGMPVVSEA